MLSRLAAAVSGILAAVAVFSAGPASAAPKVCPLGGVWNQTTENVGPTTWTITDDGKAQESGGGRATGRAFLSNGRLRIEWTTADGYAGTYQWTLDPSTPDCSGTGTLLFTKVAEGDPRGGKSFASTVSGPAPFDPAAVSPRPPSGPPRVIAVKINGGSFHPNPLVARDRDKLRICNPRDGAREVLFSFSSFNRFGGRSSKSAVKLRPGTCVQLELHNPRGKPIEVVIHSDLSSRELRIRVFPRQG